MMTQAAIPTKSKSQSSKKRHGLDVFLFIHTIFPVSSNQLLLQEEEEREEEGQKYKRCVICLEDMQDELGCVQVPDCKHIYHANCIFPWSHIERTCPQCRAPLPRLCKAVTDPHILMKGFLEEIWDSIAGECAFLSVDKETLESGLTRTIDNAITTTSAISTEENTLAQNALFIVEDEDCVDVPFLSVDYPPIDDNNNNGAIHNSNNSTRETNIDMIVATCHVSRQLASSVLGLYVGNVEMSIQHLQNLQSDLRQYDSVEDSTLCDMVRVAYVSDATLEQARKALEECDGDVVDALQQLFVCSGDDSDGDEQTNDDKVVLHDNNSDWNNISWDPHYTHLLWFSNP